MILVVGANGFLGRETVRQLLAAGERVRAVARVPDTVADLKELGAEVVHADLIDSESLASGCHGIDAVFAAAHSLMGVGKYASHLVDGAHHRALIDAAKRAQLSSHGKGVLMQLLGLAFAALALLATTVVDAQNAAWPTKSIRWIIPYPPGGITDSATRVVVQKVAEQTGWTIIVENKPGANSILGADIAAKSAPDGYTFLTVIAAHAANATLYAGKLPFDVVKSFAPVSLVGIAPLIMTANNDLPVKDVRELIAFAKANPGKVSYGSSGVGAAAHLTTELFNQTAGVDMVHVPYKGTAPALQDLMGGNIQILVDVPSTLMPQVRAGKIKALGMFSAKRVAGATEVPTIAEAGGPLIEASTWVLFLAPAGTPHEIVNRMATETAKAVASTDIKGRFETIGIDPVGNTPDEAGKFLDEEIAKWAKVISTAGVKPER